MKKFILTLVLVAVLGVSLASAVWPFGGSITGNAIADNTAIDDSQYNYCEDSDGGFFASAPGVVTYKRIIGQSEYTDTCNKNGLSVKEYFCNEKGKYSSQWVKCEYGCEDGACRTEPTCTSQGGFVIDTLGKAHANICNGKNWVTYTCTENGTVEVETTTCSSQCQQGIGCVGTCEGDSDPENDPEVKGILMVDGVETNADTCSGEAVIQYECADGAVKKLAKVACGSDQVCAEDDEGAYCKDLYAGADDLYKYVTESEVKEIVSEEIPSVLGSCSFNSLDDLMGMRTCEDVCSLNGKISLLSLATVVIGDAVDFESYTIPLSSTEDLDLLSQDLSTSNQTSDLTFHCLCC